MQAPSLVKHAVVTPQTDVCAACGRAIGPLEQPYLWDENVVCFGCHRDLSEAKEGGELQPGQTERIFFSDDRVTITRSLVLADGSTYAIPDIRFARLARTVPRRAYPVAGLLVGLGTSVFGFGHHLDSLDMVLLILGGVLFSVGLAVTLLRRPRYSVLITINGAELRILTTTRAKYATAVVDAIGEAVVERGQFIAENPPEPLGLPAEIREGLQV
jgi:hypothetical protein